MSSKRIDLIVFGLIALPAATAMAHPFHATSNQGLVEGILHPLHGLDHLLAFIAVGILSAQLGGRAAWAIPCAFVASMIAGGLVGATAGTASFIEWGIAASIIVLGAAIAWNQRFPLLVAMLVTGMFAFFHGQAHGAELPTAANPLLFALGVVGTTLVVQLTSMAAGRSALASAGGTWGVRLSGGALAALGLCSAFLMR